jgi:hypothetical protein
VRAGCAAALVELYFLLEILSLAKPPAMFSGIVDRFAEPSIGVG